MNQRMMRLSEATAFSSSEYVALTKKVSQGESLHLEFKRKAAFPEKMTREIIAFANTAGGTLLIGVNDDGEIPGIKYPEEEALALNQALEAYCSPILSPQPKIIALPEKRYVLQYTVDRGANRPYYFHEKGQKKIAYIRVDDKSVKASREMLEIIRRSKGEKGIRFYFGDHEKQLMEFLELNPIITLPDFMRISGLNRYKASRKLVLLTLASVLKITPTERGDIYSRL